MKVTLDLTPDEAEEILNGLSNRTKQVKLTSENIRQVDALGLRLCRAFSEVGLFQHPHAERPNDAVWESMQRREIRMSIQTRNRW